MHIKDALFAPKRRRTANEKNPGRSPLRRIARPADASRFRVEFRPEAHVPRNILVLRDAHREVKERRAHSRFLHFGAASIAVYHLRHCTGVKVRGPGAVFVFFVTAGGRYYLQRREAVSHLASYYESLPRRCSPYAPLWRHLAHVCVKRLSERT